MALSVYNASVPVFTHGLNNLSVILKKGEAHAEAEKIDPLILTAGRLYPDMFPLSRQTQIACDMVKGGAARLAGVEVPSFPDTETTFPELQERIQKTLDFMASLKPEQFDGAEDKTVSLKIGKHEVSFKGDDYLFKFVLPNLHFHSTVVYSILRHNGVEVGKMQYLGDIR